LRFDAKEQSEITGSSTRYPVNINVRAKPKTTTDCRSTPSLSSMIDLFVHEHGKGLQPAIISTSNNDHLQ
jgi:hypothetical protein